MELNFQEIAFWTKISRVIEQYTGERVPKCIEHIFSTCGYNHPLSFENFSEDSLTQVEEHIRKFSQNAIKRFDCSQHGCLIAHYKDQRTFKLLPGHRMLIKTMVTFIDRDREENRRESSQAILRGAIEKHSGLSFVMKEMIRRAISIHQDPKAEYTDVMKHFATYIFTLCGRSCYGALSKNLPLPSISTNCKYTFHEFGIIA